MPSASLTLWRNDRTPRLNEVDIQCTSSHAIVPANPNLVDENIRGFILLLSAHFQGFCRDLYTECAQIIASRVRPTLQVLVQQQFTAHRSLDHGNPNIENIKKDFNRFGFSLNMAACDPANHARLERLTIGLRMRHTAPVFISESLSSANRPRTRPRVRPEGPPEPSPGRTRTTDRFPSSRGLKGRRSPARGESPGRTRTTDRFPSSRGLKGRRSPARGESPGRTRTTDRFPSSGAA